MEAEGHCPIEKIHETTHLVEGILLDKLTDIVPAYSSIAIFTPSSVEEVMALLSNAEVGEVSNRQNVTQIEIPICYELGMDLEEVAAHAILSVDEVIEMHLNAAYRSLFIGFTPGFIYADGLDDKLACPRKENPRTKIPAGSIGIGGAQTGIYSLASPGGWNIIGRTPVKLFDLNRTSPMLIEVGTRFTFKRISQEQFEEWEN